MDSEIVPVIKDDSSNLLISTASDSSAVLSKNQRKKLAKREKWLLHRPQRRAIEKAKLKAKRKDRREKGLVTGPSRKQLKLSKMVDSPCKMRIAFDMSLDHLMTEMEVAKCLKQLHRCYSLNRRADAPLQLYITSFSGPVYNKMSSTAGSLKWDLHYREEAYTEVFEKDQIVYLTSDSPNVVEQLDHDKVYIVGGLVDHNRCKGICYEKALEAKIYHARLPIDEYLVMKTRKVLTIDQVYLILLRASEGKSWSDAFLDVIPKRKNVELKDSGATNCSGSETRSSEDEVTSLHEEPRDEEKELKDEENAS